MTHHTVVNKYIILHTLKQKQVFKVSDLYLKHTLVHTHTQSTSIFSFHRSCAFITLKHIWYKIVTYSKYQ